MALTLLKEQFQLSRNALDSTNSDLQQSNAEADRLRKELAAAPSSEDLEQSRAETGRLRDELAAAASQKQLLESKLELLNRDLRHLRSANSKLREELAETKETTKASVSRLHSQLTAATSQKQVSASQLQEMHRDAPELQRLSLELIANARAVEERQNSAKNAPPEKSNITIPSEGKEKPTTHEFLLKDPTVTISPKGYRIEHIQVHCDSYLPLINVSRVREHSRRLHNHQSMFRQSNQWFYPLTEKGTLAAKRVQILSDDLKWHVAFMNDLNGDLSLWTTSDLYRGPSSSPLGQLRQEAERITRAASVCADLQWASVNEGTEQLASSAAMVQCICEESMTDVLAALERCLLLPQAKRGGSSGAP